MPHLLHSFPKAILHIDGDAFFASCEQSLHPELRGKPVITGRERGIAASVSYEAKARGVLRGMPIHEIKKICPDVIWLPSDYETYSLLSKRFYDIVRRYTSDVEEYGIDECFADITGLRRPLRKSYPDIAAAVQYELSRELGCTFSIGLSCTKVLAKLGSKWKKPFGLTVMPTRSIPDFLAQTPVEKLWGIGPQTTALLNKYRIVTALDFAQRSEDWVKDNLSKPFYEIWQELNCKSVMPLVLAEKESYYSIQKFKTFTPPSTDRAFVFSQLSKNIENACIKVRRYHQAAKEVVFCLRTQDFRNYGLSVKLSRQSNFAHEIVKVAESVFDELYRPNVLYRQTGVVLAGLTTDEQPQLDLFGSHLKAEAWSRVYEGIDDLAAKFGKHTVFLGSSFSAQARPYQAVGPGNRPQHVGSRGDQPVRKVELFKGESSRRRIGIPLFMTPNEI